MLRAVALALFLPLIASAALAEGRTMIVLDASGSMWGQIDGRTKVEIAREVMAEVLGTLDPAAELGLVVYGHRRRGDCSDIEVAVEAAPGTAGAIVDFANRTRFQGKTPLTEAVRVAAAALRSTEEKATVILITDGIETCEADPCALGAELEATGVDFTAHVVGFGLTEEEGRAVACLAEATGGLYLPAADAAQLGEALTRTVAAEPEPEPEPEPQPEPAALEFNLAATASLAEGGEDFDGEMFWQVTGPSGNAVTSGYGPSYQVGLPPGEYELKVQAGEVEQERPVTLTASELAEEHFVLNAGVVTLVGRRSEGGDEDAAIYVEASQGEAIASGYGHITSVMPAGEIVLKGRQGSAETTKTITLAPGKQAQIDIVVGSGIVTASALYAPGGPAVEADDAFFEVLAVAPKIDGSRDSYSSRYAPGPMDVPSGEFVMTARLGKAEAMSEPFNVQAGGRTEVQLVLNAGVAFVSAPGADSFRVLSEAKDIQGNRRDIGFGYGESYQETLPAGRYVVVVHYAADRPDMELPLEVKAGERVELAAP